MAWAFSHHDGWIPSVSFKRERQAEAASPFTPNLGLPLRGEWHGVRRAGWAGRCYPAVFGRCNLPHLVRSRPPPHFRPQPPHLQKGPGGSLLGKGPTEGNLILTATPNCLHSALFIRCSEALEPGAVGPGAQPRSSKSLLPWKAETSKEGRDSAP